MNILENPIVIFTHSHEVNVDRVVSILKEQGYEYIRIDIDSIIDQANDLTITEESPGDEPCLYSDKMGFKVQSTKIRSVWYRRPEWPKPTKADMFSSWTQQEIDFLKGEYSGFLWSLYTTLPGYWMNRPLYGTHLLEHNKLYQMQIAKKSGLCVPRTIISNNPEQILSFAKSCNGKVAVKCIKQRVFSNDDSTHNGIYTNIVSIADLMRSRASLSVCPVMLQEYIEKKIELRITIVGKQVFACAIHSQDEVRTKIDWRRYGEKWVKHEVFVLPEYIKDRLLESMKSWGIVFGAIDMIVTPENGYVFLEVNPSGQYGWIEGLTGMPISRAIADVLSNPNV